MTTAEQLIDDLGRQLSHADTLSIEQQIHSRYRLALAHFECLRIDEAARLACQALAQAVALPWPTAMTPPPATGFDADRAQSLLTHTLAQLAQQRLVAFATGGSLLGLTREGRLLPQDKDLDIATPMDHFERVAASLVGQGWQPAPIPLRASNFKSFCHPASGITLALMGTAYDAARRKVVGGWWPSGQARETGRVLQFTPFAVELRLRGAQTSWVVAEPETLLTELFGPNWRSPDPDYISLFETPALVEHTPFSHVLGYLQLLQAWLGGWPARYARLLQALYRLDPDDPGLQQRPALPAAKVGAGETARQAVASGLRQALGHFAANRIAPALASAQQAVQQAAALPLPDPLPSPMIPIDTAQAWPLLQQTLTRLAAAKLQAFAFGGVLLGLVREGRLLTNDKDLDVVVPWPQFTAACQQLTAAGWQAASIPVRADNFRCFMHHPSGITLDLFGYDFQAADVIGGWWPTGLPRRAGRLLRFNPFALQQIDSEHGRHWAIARPEPVLAELYGPNWRTPDPIFDATLETPALVAYTDYTRCWGLLRLLEAWTHGQRDACRRRLQVLARRDPVDPLLESFCHSPLLKELPPC